MSRDNFKTWLKLAKETDDPAGDLIGDAKADRKMPELATEEELNGYLTSRGACVDCVDQVPEVWRRYQAWKGGRK